MNKRIATVAAAALVAGIGSYFLTANLPAVTHRPPARAQTLFTETKWPFPIDEWGDGWAYECKAADCGTEVNVYLRPKLGFCNCQTGVADDAELDRVGDIDLFGNERSALGAGEPIKVLGMKGRSRSYKVGAGAGKSVLSLAFNNRCDVVVATVLAGDRPAAQEQAVLEFLNGELIQRWTAQVLGL